MNDQILPSTSAQKGLVNMLMNDFIALLSSNSLIKLLLYAVGAVK